MIPVLVATALSAALALAAPAARAGNAPAVNYRLYCSGCHLEDGSGKPSKGIPAMNGVVGHFLKSPEGRAFLLQVPGVANTPLSDREIAELSNWLQQSMAGASRPESFEPFTADEVTRLRRHGPADVAAARRAIAQRLLEQGVRLDDAP